MAVPPASMKVNMVPRAAGSSSATSGNADTRAYSNPRVPTATTAIPTAAWVPTRPSDAIAGAITSAPMTIERRLPDPVGDAGRTERAHQLGDTDEEDGAADAGGREAEGVLQPHPLDHHDQLDRTHEQGDRGQGQHACGPASATTHRPVLGHGRVGHRRETARGRRAADGLVEQGVGVQHAGPAAPPERGCDAHAEGRHARRARR